MELHHQLPVPELEHAVQGLAAVGSLHSRHPAQGLQVPLLQAQGGEKLQIKETLTVEELIRCGPHIRGGGPEPHQEHDPQGHHQQNGQEAGQRAPDLPGQICAQASVHYHSILSMGVGVGFT